MAAADATGADDFGTPALFVNGRLVAGARPIDDFRAVIDAELARTAAAR